MPFTTVAPYPPSPSACSTVPHDPDGLHRHGRSSVEPAMGEQRPDYSGHFVSECDPNQHWRRTPHHAGHHDPGFGPLRDAQPAIALVPMLSRRRNVRPPMLDVRLNRSLPSLDRCTGVRPSQAAKSRPSRKVAAAGADAMKTAKLNDVNPQEWLADVLDRIGEVTQSTGSTNCYRGNSRRSALPSDVSKQRASRST